MLSFPSKQLPHECLLCAPLSAFAETRMQQLPTQQAAFKNSQSTCEPREGSSDRCAGLDFAAGAGGITVSSLPQAHHFSNHIIPGI